MSKLPVMTDQEKACDAAWERARENCEACQAYHAPVVGGYFTPCPHTCYGDIEAVKAVAMAAVREVDVAIHTDWTEMRVSRIFREAMAELERLLEVKHD